MSQLVYERFEQIYYQNVKERINQIFGHNKYNVDIINSIDKGKNHYHSGILYLLSRLIKNDKCIYDLCAIAEFSWMTILTIDDLCDNEKIRRGEQSLWVRKGTYFTIQSSLYSSYQIIQATIKHKELSKFTSFFLKDLMEISIGQINLVNLNIRSSSIDFIKTGLLISQHFPCFVNFLLADNYEFKKQNTKTWKLLQIASIIKNQLEDIFAPNNSYKIEGNDVINKQATYVIKHLTESLEYVEQREQVYSYFKNAEDFNWTPVLEILRNNTRGKEQLRDLLYKIINKADANFQNSIIKFELDTELKQVASLITQWIKSYKFLGNPNIGIIELD